MPTIPDPGFAGDDGSADPHVSAALADYASGGEYVAALAAIAGSRLVVPVVAVPAARRDGRRTTSSGAGTQVDERRQAHDRTSDLATVLIARPDGRRGMLAFTSTDALATWDRDARPVPVGARHAARAAVQEGAEALLVDVAGPVRFTITGDDLRGLAAGWRLARVGERSAWIRPGPE